MTMLGIREVVGQPLQGDFKECGCQNSGEKNIKRGFPFWLLSTDSLLLELLPLERFVQRTTDHESYPPDSSRFIFNAC